MNRTRWSWMLVAAIMTGCAAGSIPTPDAQPASDAPTRSPVERPAADPAAPLVLDRADVALGTTVEFHRLPNVLEMHDAAGEFALRHVIVALDAWPAPGSDFSGLGQLPVGTDALVILPGYAPDRATLALWNELGRGVRVVIVVNGPPSSGIALDELNTLRTLERVVARMETPSRAGFERLQRPLSFVKRVN